MNVQLLVLAKAPVPGRVKTRLCPPCTPVEAAALARAALQDTLDAVRATPAQRRVLAIDHPGELGDLSLRGFEVITQRGPGLATRIAAAFADAAAPGLATVLVGMDTPQVGPDRLAAVGARLVHVGVDAVLGPARDGGWWTLGLHDPRHADLLRDVPMSRPDTGNATRVALRAAGLRIAAAPVERDVDTAADAAAAAAAAPESGFAAAWRQITARAKDTRTDTRTAARAKAGVS
ncbi:TIGR04282 family arsenosugar biosynthesis glycosyltransferase [Cryptosporangium arvum]|uniref:Glycosyltransferase n=1 Tax=Cryptosporangium arvum DSM 44712 TaxID=927661 RepID=A0A010YMX3_9ACTN|nr:DUF2064 domain-containing protein [Cryptosporangium arvum]EXG81560.1 hypothetical protein CryarDRAFT_2676 [Cryptosporangium arvum DSM 44712]